VQINIIARWRWLYRVQVVLSGSKERTMNYVERMLETHPAASSLDREALQSCIEACFECVACCVSCADACLSEEKVADLRFCIRTNLDCADICAATGRVLTRQSQPDWSLIRSQLQACAAACKACGDECAKHQNMHEHCKVCSDCCRHCEESCNKLLQALPQ